MDTSIPRDRIILDIVGEAIYSIVLIMLLLHFLIRKFYYKVKLSGLTIFFYISVACFLIVRILWITLDFYYEMPYQDSKGNQIFSHSAKDKFHFVFNRFSSVLYIIIYTSIVISWFLFINLTFSFSFSFILG